MDRTTNGLMAAALMAVLGGGSIGCGEVVRTGRAPVYLVIDGLAGASGIAPDDFFSQLASDVQTKGSVFADPGRVELRMALKDIGPAGNPAAPTDNNAVTITRYRVSYRRTDGRNAPGLDVPHGFEGAATATVSGLSTLSVGFELVRLQAKLESPLRGLRDGGAAVAISTIADVTFYGRDQAGNDVNVTGSITVTFADWADPDD